MATKLNKLDEMSATGSKKETSESAQITALNAKLRGMEILLQQNSALEKEVERLCYELDEVTRGVQKKGYLHKYRDREIYYASKWGLRYFVLQGNMLSYYGDDQERRPRRTIDLSKCFVRSEGKKKGGLYHVFSIYLGSNADNTVDGSLLLRLSAENAAESRLWIDMLEQACAIGDESFSPDSPAPANGGSSSGSSNTATNSLSSPKSKQKSGDVQDDWHHEPIDELPDNDESAALALAADSSLLSGEMLTRVRSSSLMLRKSMSRQTMARRVLSGRAPNVFTKSGHRLAELPTTNEKAVHPAPSATPKEGLPKSFPGYKPMHIHAAPSPLSSEAPSGMHNYRGFFNLGLIILALTHVELVVNNMSKYGLKIAMPVWNTSATLLTQGGGDFFSRERLATGLEEYAVPLGWTGFWAACILINLVKERLAARFLPSERLVLYLNFLVGTLVVALPVYWVWTSVGSSPSANMLYLFQSVIIWMKLVSYSHANKDLRVAHKKSLGRQRGGVASKDSSSADLTLDNNAKPAGYGSSVQQMLSEVKDLQPPFLLYPQNLTLRNIGYFSVAPTLCYQLNYPRTSHIRWSHVALLLFRMMFVAAMVLFAVEQYIKPTLETVLQPMREMDIPKIGERLLKLSIPSTYVWLLGFYFYFHLWLNLLAELTRFGDRQFYKDWWNAKSIDRYW